MVNFETELDRDVLRGLLNDRFGEVTLEWSGQKSPGHLAILPSEKVYLHFYTDHVTSMDGFELQFNSGRLLQCYHSNSEHLLRYTVVYIRLVDMEKYSSVYMYMFSFLSGLAIHVKSKYINS